MNANRMKSLRVRYVDRAPRADAVALFIVPAGGHLLESKASALVMDIQG